jgi:phenylalanyl-tRNA synthetase, alpha subunit
MDFCLALILYARYSYFKCAPIKFDENVEKGGFFKKAKDEIVAKFDKELLIKFDDKGRILGSLSKAMG